MRTAALAARAAWALRSLLRLFVPRSQLLALRRRWYDAQFRRGTRGFAPATQATAAGGFPAGINIIGYLRAESGVGEGARSSVRAARAAGIPLSLIDFTTGCPSRMSEAIPSGLPTGEKHAINLVHVNADEVPTVFVEFGAAFYRRHYNIAFWNWELPEFPPRWAPYASIFNEIWTPSRFVRDAVAKVVDVPVRCLPFSVEPPGVTVANRSAWGLPPQGVAFLAMFDALSIAERKNPLGALEAFRLAFGERHPGALLVVKVINAGGRGAAVDTLRRAARNDRSVIIIEHYLDRPGLTSLMNACDCLVSLHRSEGFGLPLLEAMALGKPVIATGWSGNADFMSAENSFPVRYALVKLDRDHGPYERGQIWAEPDLRHAAECMRGVVADRTQALLVGRRAQAAARSAYSAAAIGEVLRQLLPTLPGGSASRAV